MIVLQQFLKAGGQRPLFNVEQGTLSPPLCNNANSPHPDGDAVQRFDGLVQGFDQLLVRIG